MLLSFTFSNFKSFSETASISLVAHKADKTIPGALIHADLGDGGEISVLPAAVIYGANAAGKSNVILAMEYFRQAIRDSQASWLPSDGTGVSLFVNSPEPARFEAEFVVKGVRYRYGFTVLPSHFVDEWLYAYPKRKERMLFERSTVYSDGVPSASVEWGPTFLGDDRDHESSKRRTRPNSLFLASCVQDNQPQCSEVHHWFRMRVTVVKTTDWFDQDDVNFTSRMCGDHKDFHAILVSLLKSADSSLSDIKISKDGQELLPEPSNDRELSDASRVANFVSNNQAYKVSFVMVGPKETFELPLSSQSRGMQKLYSVATDLIFALRYGEVVFFDELEGSMHPHVASRLVSIFQSRSSNPNGAQLVFTTHDTNFLNIKHVRRDQIWFVEKDQSQSHLYPLLDFAPRKDESLEQGYLKGKYGAIPVLGLAPDWALGVTSGAR